MEAGQNIRADLQLGVNVEQGKRQSDELFNHLQRRVTEIHGLISRLEERASTGVQPGRSSRQAASVIAQGIDAYKRWGIDVERGGSDVEARFNRLKQQWGGLEENLNKVDDAAEKVERRFRGVPAYLGTVINTVAQAAQMYANLYRAERMAFDLGSPQGFANAQAQLEITRIQQMYSGGGRIAGAVVGGLAGAAFGGPLGALAGTYLGGQVFGQIGDFMGTIMTADRERQLKTFNELYGRQGRAVAAYTPVESLLATIGVRGGRGLSGLSASGTGPAQEAALRLALLTSSAGSDADFGGLYNLGRANRLDLNSVMGLGAITRLTGIGGTAGLVAGIAGRQGLTNPQQLQELIMQLPQLFMRAGQQFFSQTAVGRQGEFLGRLPEVLFGAGNVPAGIMRTPGGRDQVESLFRAMTSPRGRAGEAFMMSAMMRGSGRGSDMLELQLRMREGLTERNLGDVMDMLQQVPENLRGYYILAMTEGQNVSTELVRKMISGNRGVLGNLRGGPRGAGIVPGGDATMKGATPGEIAQAKLEEAAVQLGETVAANYRKIVSEFELFVNSLAAGRQAQEAVAKMLKDVQTKLEEFQKETFNQDFLSSTGVPEANLGRTERLNARAQAWRPGRFGEYGIVGDWMRAWMGLTSLIDRGMSAAGIIDEPEYLKTLPAPQSIRIGDKRFRIAVSITPEVAPTAGPLKHGR